MIEATIIGVLAGYILGVAACRLGEVIDRDLRGRQ